MANDAQTRADRDAALVRNVTELVALASNDEACRLLGVEGVLEPQLDISFLDDPLDWIAYDIAQGIKSNAEEKDEQPGPTLSVLVAEIRLLRIMNRDLNQAELIRLVQEYLDEEED